MVQVLNCFFDRIKLEGIIIWILVQSDTVMELILPVGPCDLYFIVQCFCLICLALSNK